MALVHGFVRARTIYIMLTAMRMLVIQHDFALPLRPIGGRLADRRYDITPHLGGRKNRWAGVGVVSRQHVNEVTPVRSNFVNGITELPVVSRTPEVAH
jgi:hypothetical protein